jgi:hypothetical protein
MLHLLSKFNSMKKIFIVITITTSLIAFAENTAQAYLPRGDDKN